MSWKKFCKNEWHFFVNVIHMPNMPIMDEWLVSKLVLQSIILNDVLSPLTTTTSSLEEGVRQGGPNSPNSLLVYIIWYSLTPLEHCISTTDFLFVAKRYHHLHLLQTTTDKIWDTLRDFLQILFTWQKQCLYSWALPKTVHHLRLAPFIKRDGSCFYCGSCHYNQHDHTPVFSKKW